jgi:hypothetical protein
MQHQMKIYRDWLAIALLETVSDPILFGTKFVGADLMR